MKVESHIVAVIGALFLVLLKLVFWGVLAYAMIHFVIKWW